MNNMLRHTIVFRAIAAIVVAIAAAVAAPTVEAQSDAQFTQYWAVPNYYNPAMIGRTDFINIRAGSRLQWAGIKHAPLSFMVTADTPFKLFGKRFVAGLVLQHESIGLYRTINVDAQIGYSFKLFGGKLTPALEIGFLNETFKGTEVVIPTGEGDTGGDDDSGSSSSSSDPALPTGDVSGNSIDLSAGLVFDHKYFYAGISARHLTQPTVNMTAGNGEGGGDSESRYEFKVGRMFYFIAGSNIPIKNTLFELQPSALLRADFKATIQADITLRARWNKMISFGINYRTQDAVSAMIAVEIKNFFIGYSYDYPITQIVKGTSGSHEVWAGYRLKMDMGEKNKNKHKSIRIM